MDGIETLNQAFFLSINAGVDTSTGLINLAMGIANELILVVPLLLLGMWLWGDAARRNLALKSCIVVFLGLGLNQLIGLVWQHPRPFVLGLGHTFMSHAAETSFPSDHLTVFAGLGLTWLLGDLLVLGVITLLAGLAVAWARIFLGVHFPLDMLGALLVSGIAYAIVTPVWVKIDRRVMTVTVSLYRRIFGRAISVGWFRY